MGLFDYIECHYPLPDGFNPTGVEFQTKDTPDQYLIEYTITPEGKLLHATYETTPKTERPYPDAEEGSLHALSGSTRRVEGGDEEVDFHGAIEFYTTGHEYVALFDHGTLLKIETVHD